MLRGQLLGALVTCALAASAYADPVNNSFENFDASAGNNRIVITGWDASAGSIGLASAASRNTPTDGFRHLVLNVYGLTPAAADADELAQFFGFSNAAEFEARHGLGAHSGVAVKQTLNVNAGEKLMFDWNLVGSQQGAAAYAFIGDEVVRLNAPVGPLGPPVLLALESNTPSVQGFSPAIRGQETGYTTTEFTFTTSGPVTIGFFVISTTTGLADSALLVDNVRKTNWNSQQVPEPSTPILILFGMVTTFLWLTYRNRRRKKT